MLNKPVAVLYIKFRMFAAHFNTELKQLCLGQASTWVVSWLGTPSAAGKGWILMLVRGKWTLMAKSQFRELL